MNKRMVSDSGKEKEMLYMLKDTSDLLAKKQTEQLEMVANVYKSSNQLTNKVEFWDWMNRNFNGTSGGMFSSNEAMNHYLARGQGQENWIYKQIQGKGYEWDWMQKQRADIKNIFKVYNAGEVSNQAAIDVTEYDLLLGDSKSYQMKAYTSSNNPNLHNTGKEITVVTNAEKADIVSNDGYLVESYKSRQEIVNDTDSRMEDIRNRKATPKYNLKNVGGAMAKSGVIGCVVGIGTEALFSYERWKNNELSDEQYLSEVLKSGGEAGTTAALSTGVMIPVSAAITAAGISSIVTVPIAFVVTAGINKVVAPCFGRGEYKRIIGKAQYYQSIESMYKPFMESMERAIYEYENFINEFAKQEKEYCCIQKKDRMVNESLKRLYDSI